MKPVCSYQQVFQSTYLFGAFSPIDGQSFMLNLPYCNTDCFQVFLNKFSSENKDELKVMILDNGAFHKAKRLIVPDNIILIFLPPYSPELNPAEKMWQRIKRNFTNKTHKNLMQVQTFICEESKKLTKEITKSTCSYKYIFLNRFWS